MALSNAISWEQKLGPKRSYTSMTLSPKYEKVNWRWCGTAILPNIGIYTYCCVRKYSTQLEKIDFKLGVWCWRQSKVHEEMFWTHNILDMDPNMNAFRFTIVLASPKNYILKENGKEYAKFFGRSSCQHQSFCQVRKRNKNIKLRGTKDTTQLKKSRDTWRRKTLQTNMGVQSAMDGFIFGSKIGKDEE